MTTITQTPEPIGPVPRCVRVDDGGSFILIFTMLFTVLAHAWIRRQINKERAEWWKRFGKANP